MTCILVGFIKNEYHQWSEDDLIYDAVNAFGSLLLILYAYMLNSWPFIILNLVWFLISFRDMFADIKRDHGISFRMQNTKPHGMKKRK